MEISQGVTAGDGLSGGGTSGTVSLALDLNELTNELTVDPSADSIAIIDGGSSNVSRKESIVAGDCNYPVVFLQGDDDSNKTNSDALRVKWCICSKCKFTVQ